MQKPFLRSSVVMAIATFPLLAQAGNEVIFVGTSTSGSTDNHAFVESGTGLVSTNPSSFTDNVTGGVWANTGRNLYVGQGLMNRVAHAEWNGTSATWSTFYPAPGSCYGVDFDQARQRLWVLTGPTGSTRELHCVDADPNSPGYGTQIVTTTTLSGSNLERWGLSPSGNLAGLPAVFISSGLFQVVDTNPTSPTFLTSIVSTTVPGTLGLTFALGSDCAISADDLYAYVLYTGITLASTQAAGLAVYDLTAGIWLDFDAGTGGQQDLNIPLVVPNRMALANDRSFVVISGQGSGGWAARVDLDYTTPSNSTFTQYAGLQIPNANAISLSPDDTRAAVTSTPQSVAPPGTLVIFDVQSGAVLHTVALGQMWNIYTTAWQDASPTATFTPYGVGCAGTAGVPTWDAAPGSRLALGSTFTAVAGNLPFAIAVAQVGLTGNPGGIDLTFLGMPGCYLFPTPIVSFALFGAGSSASWQFGVPNTPGLFGVELHSQAFPLDPAANAFGFTASNAAVGVLGF